MVRVCMCVVGEGGVLSIILTKSWQNKTIYHTTSTVFFFSFFSVEVFVVFVFFFVVGFKLTLGLLFEFVCGCRRRARARFELIFSFSCSSFFLVFFLGLFSKYTG